MPSDTWWAFGLLAFCVLALVAFVWVDMWDQSRQQDKLEQEIEELRQQYEELNHDE